VVAPTGFVR